MVNYTSSCFKIDISQNATKYMIFWKALKTGNASCDICLTH